MRRVGIFCGFFNPPLDCHIAAAEAALQRYALDEIVIAPLLTARGDTWENAGYIDRVCMCIASVFMKSGLSVIERPSPASLPQLLRWYRKKQPDVRLFCILDVALFASFTGRQSDAAALNNVGFICLSPNETESGTVSRYALSEGIDMDPMPFPSLSDAESAARNRIHSMNDPEGMAPGALKICALHGLYLEDHAHDVKNALNNHRWHHTLGVRTTAVALAEKFGASPVKCAAAALYHDCAKDMNPKEMRRIMTAHGEDGDEELLQSGAMMHGPVGAYIAEEKYHVRDREVLDAIRYHTAGREEMTLTDLVIFVADAIEPGREDYPGLNEIRALSDIDLRAAALYSLYVTRDYVLSRGKSFHKSGQNTITALERRLSGDGVLDPNAKKMLRERSAAFD